MHGEYEYDAATAGDSGAIVEWEKLADLELNCIYQPILHTVTKYFNLHGDFIGKKLASRKLLFKVNGDEETLLHLAAKNEHQELVKFLIAAAKKLDPKSLLLHDLVWHFNGDKNTALHLAITHHRNFIIFTELITASPPRSRDDIKNHMGETPIYLAIKQGFYSTIHLMCEHWKIGLPLDCPQYDSTPLLFTGLINTHRYKVDRRAIGVDVDLVMQLLRARDKTKEMPYSGYETLFEMIDKNYDTLISLSVRENLPRVIDQILDEDPAYKNGRVRKSNDLKSLISVAARKGYADMVKVLTISYQARKDIGHAGQTTLHAAIIKRDDESLFRHLKNDENLVSKTDSEYWTPLHYAAYYEFDSVLEALSIGHKAEDYQSPNEARWVPTPLYLAAKEGHTSTLKKLMELLPASLFVVADSLTHQNILHLAVLGSNKEMILHILDNCGEGHIDKILNQQDIHGDTPLHLLIRDGCFVPELIKHKRIDRMVKNKQNWTSFDMLYLQDQIIADQVKIKKALDDLQADQHPKFWQCLKLWHRSMKNEPKLPKSLVPPSKRKTKDLEFMKAKKLLMKQDLIQKKDELDRYRQRTNTQIIVTALITTVTFTVGFTMPGGYHQDQELQGMVLLSNKKAFIAFMVSDALALLLSTSSLFLYFIASMYEDPRSVSKLNDASTVLNIVSVIAMMLTFITGTYVVLSHSQALAITICVISCFFFLLVIIGLLIKWRYDRKQEKMHDV